MCNEKKPKISVIVPTYHRADRVTAAVDSILNQTYDNFEIVIVDDNPPNSSYQKQTMLKLSKYKNNRKVRIVHTAGSTGGGAARNYAVKFATGEYLAFLDDDDEFLPDKLETQIQYMLKNKLDMSYQDIAWYDEKGRLVESRKLDHVKSFTKNELLRANILTPISPTAIYMLKKDLFEKTKGFGEVIMGQDWFLMLRCIEADAKIGYMAGVHVHQYLSSGPRISTGENKLKGEEYLYQYKKKYYSLLSKKDIKYVDFRHYAVLAFACKRSGFYLRALKYALKTFTVSPLYCIQQSIRFFRK